VPNVLDLVVVVVARDVGCDIPEREIVVFEVRTTVAPVRVVPVREILFCDVARDKVARIGVGTVLRGLIDVVVREVVIPRLLARALVAF